MRRTIMSVLAIALALAGCGTAAADQPDVAAPPGVQARDGYAAVQNAYLDWLTTRTEQYSGTVAETTADRPPIDVEMLTPRSEFTDDVSGQFKVKLDGQAPLTTVTFSPDGALLAGASEASPTQPVWDVGSGELLFSLTGHEGSARSIAFSPDGRRLATGGNEGTVWIWDAATGAPHTSLALSAAALDAFSPDGRYLAAGQDDGRVAVWDASSLRHVRTLETEQGPVEGVTFGPSGRLYTAGTDGSARIWDLETGTELTSLRGHDVVVSQVAVTSDESMAATTSDDGTTKLWDLATGQELFTLFGHEMLVYGVDFSPDDRLLATASPDGIVAVHLLPIDEFVEVARSRVTRSLTTDECRQYLHVPRCPQD